MSWKGPFNTIFYVFIFSDLPFGVERRRSRPTPQRVGQSNVGQQPRRSRPTTMLKNDINSIDVAQIRCGEGGAGGEAFERVLVPHVPRITYTYYKCGEGGGWAGNGGGKFRCVVVLHARTRTTSIERYYK